MRLTCQTCAGPTEPCGSEPYSSEQGSAFVLVLLAILLITTLGLSLAMVTETEMQMGGNEKVINQTFYASDSGIQAALGKLMTTQDWGGAEFALKEGSLGQVRNLGSRVTTSRVHAIGAPRPAPMTIANEGQDLYKSYFVVVTSTAQRVSWPSSDDAPSFNAEDPNTPIQAQMTTTSRFLLSPLRQPATGSEPFNEQKVLVER